MKTLKKLTTTMFAICMMAALAACTTADVDQTLPTASNVQSAPVPQTNINQATLQNGQQAGANALASAGNASPTQAVTEAQLQQRAAQQANQQVQGAVNNANQQVASLAPVPDTSRAITFLPFEGAPQIKNASLTRFLNSSAQTNNLAVFPATQSGAKYKVKGYFSALNDGNGTLLVYVWDVTDNSGKRLHRINGRERTGTTRTDPWQAITDSELQKVAEATTARLKTWVSRR